MGDFPLFSIQLFIQSFNFLKCMLLTFSNDKLIMFSGDIPLN